MLAACDDTLVNTPRPAAPSLTHGGASSRIVWDDFTDGFTVGAADSKWFYFAAPPFSANDGITTTSRGGLRVRSSGTNPRTGAPAFVNTLAQESANGGVPGGLDHAKWLVFMNHTASTGYPGWDARDGRELRCEITAGGRTFGTGAHPFGARVADAEDDLRLAAAAMVNIDFESYMVFDFWMTNERIYAFYERLPFARGEFGNYAAFSYAVPVALRRPNASHNLKVAYDRSAGVVRWLIDDREVFRVDQIGHRIDRKYLLIDHGGVDTTVTPRQLDCGMGMFTLLDGARGGGEGLVRLSEAPDFYFNPRRGEPVAQSFFDETSRDGSRLFGQGAELRVRQYAVSSVPAGR